MEVRHHRGSCRAHRPSHCAAHPQEKAKQKAEQALWDKWDEEEIAEEKKEAADAAAKETAATGAEEQNK